MSEPTGSASNNRTNCAGSEGWKVYIALPVDQRLIKVLDSTVWIVYISLSNKE